MPRAQGTLTIPATARRVISVGAYDARLNAYADFSGRGSCNLPYPKPDLTAPGVDILAPRAGGGYARFSGTSFSTPFVTGAAALLMEWGIIRGNDPYLYGEKLKAYLRRGARPFPGVKDIRMIWLGGEHYVQRKVSLKYEKCKNYYNYYQRKMI